jgi:signal transduction histidine kinase
MISERRWSRSPVFALLLVLVVTTLGYLLLSGLAPRTPFWGRILAFVFPSSAVVVFLWYFQRLGLRQNGDLFLKYSSRVALITGVLYALPGIGITIQQQSLGTPLLNGDVLIMEMWLGGSMIGLAIGHLYARSRVKQRHLRQGEKELEQQRQQLTVLNRVLRHDIRTEVDLILSATSQLATTVDDSTQIEEITEHCWKIVEIGDNARRIETMMANGNVSTTAAEVTEIVEECVADLKCQSSTVTVSTDMPEEAYIVSNGYVAIVVRNVLTNAVEHNDAAVPEVDVTVRTTSSDDEVQIRITDNGPGIPEQEREVFETFDETALQHSSGLGLWLVHWIVRDLNGTVEIETRQPRGTVVTLGIPQAPTALDESSRATH